MGRVTVQPVVLHFVRSHALNMLVHRQSQLAKMTSELCDGGGDEQREKEAPATSKSSSVSPLSVAALLELHGPWSSPLSPVTLPTGPHTVNCSVVVC